MANLTVEEEKKRDAEKCLQIAEIAFSSNNYEKAERILLKAERLYPTTLAKEMLKDIRAAKGERENGSASEDTDGGYNSESSNTTFSGEYQRTDDDRKASESCIAIAKSAISAGRFDKAKNFLLKSIRLYPNDSAKELLEKLDDLKKNYSPTSYNGINSTLGNKEEAEKCVQIAQTEFAASRLARAERLLRKAERLYSTTRAKDLLRQIEDAISKGVKDTDEGKPQKPKLSQQETDRLRQNQESERPKRKEPTTEQIEAIRRVKEGKDDYEILGVEKQSNQADVKKAFRRLTLLQKAERLIIKSERICREYEVNQQEAKNCVESAQQAFDQRDFDTAERMFTKALRMNPSDYIRDCLIKVQREKEKILEEEKSRKIDEVFKAQRNSEMVTNQEKAEQFVSLALRAFELEANYTAEKYLIKALYLRHSDTTADILAEVRESINKNIRVRSNKKISKQKNNDEQEKEKEMKIEANKYLKTAEEQLARGDLINAQFSAIISDSFFRSAKSEQLLHRISELQFNAEKKKKKKIQDYIIFKSEFYIESAKIAIANGDIKLAEKYLRHSDKIKPSVTAKTMLQEVLTANNCDQNPSTSRQTGGDVLSKFSNLFE